MPLIRTNLLRIEIGSSHLVYQAELRCEIPLEEEFLPQIEGLIYSALPLTVYHPPLLYSAQPLSTTTYQFFLSTGAPLTLCLLQQAQQQNSKQILPQIAARLMRLTDLMYCWPLRAVFNPYEEKDIEGERMMPGVRVEGAEGALWIEAGVLVMVQGEIGEGDVLMDYHSGKFYLKQSIVRVDKARGQVTFRSGGTVSKSALYPVELRPLSGYPLANQLHNAISRIKECSADFAAEWNISYDNRLLQSPYQPIQPGHLTFRDNQERSLTQLATPITQHSYLHNFNTMFKGISLCDMLQAQIIWLCSQAQHKWAMAMGKTIDGLKFRMSLNVTSKMQLYHSLEQAEEVVTALKRDAAQVSPQKIYILPHCKLVNKGAKEGWEAVLQALIDIGVRFHCIEIDPTNRQYDFQAGSYRHLCILYTKFGLNPWIIKGIPFSNTPMTAISLHVQTTRKGMVSVAAVATMNLYMTKFTANRRLCAFDGTIKAIQEGIKECIDKFQSAHGRYPNRIMVFRCGMGEEGDLREEARTVKQAFLRLTGSVITYVMPTCIHPLRTYNEIDRNYLSKDTAKKVQLLLYTNVQGEIYCQLELDQPMHRIRIFEMEPNDPNFIAKVLELTAKLVLSGVGNTFGRGLGFLDYAKRLNHYRELELQRYRMILRDGVLSFL